MSSRYVQPLRILVQFCFLAVMIRTGVLFFRFVQGAASGFTDPALTRPPGVDGFLPISGLLGVTSFMRGDGINSIHPAAVIFFITILALSFLLRRSFCSWICPIATVSECLWKFGFTLTRRNRRVPGFADVSFRSVKYVLLGFFVYSVVFSMSGRSLLAFIQSDYHKLADVRLMYFFLHMTPSAIITIVLLLIFSALIRNPFCRFICPYGALLGLVAVVSPVRVTRNLDRCVSCGVCSQVCPSRIDVMHASSVMSPECIGCWRCVSHCRFNEALSMRVVQKTAISGILFAILVVMLFWGGIELGRLAGYWENSITHDEYIRLLGG